MHAGRRRNNQQKHDANSSKCSNGTDFRKIIRFYSCRARNKCWAVREGNGAILRLRKSGEKRGHPFRTSQTNKTPRVLIIIILPVTKSSTHSKIRKTGIKFIVEKKNKIVAVVVFHNPRRPSVCRNDFCRVFNIAIL